MAKIYYNVIKAGQWVFESVPLRWRTEVQAMLEADNSQTL